MLIFFILLPFLCIAEQFENALFLFEKYIEKSLKDWGEPGLAVVVLKDNNVVFEKVYGAREVGHAHKINLETTFPVASISKTFLIALTAKFVEEGKLKWEDPVQKFLPDFFVHDEEISRQITIKDLLTHSIGLPAFSLQSLWDLDASPKELVAAMKYLPTKHRPGKVYGYQNIIFGIMHLILEKASGKNIDALYTTYFFKPLHMSEAFVGTPNHQTSWWRRLVNLLPFSYNAAKPHTQYKGRVVSFPTPSQMYTFSASTGVHLSLKDMEKWLRAQDNYLKPETQKMMQTPFVFIKKIKEDNMQFPPHRYHQPAYGIGWFLYDYGTLENKTPIIAHMGSFSGTRSLVAMAPEKNIKIAILSNFGSIQVSLLPEMLHNKLFDLLLGIKDDIDWSKKGAQEKEAGQKQFDAYIKGLRAVPKPPEPNSFYVGAYTNELYGTLDIFEKEKKLFIRIHGKEAELFHISENIFHLYAFDLSPSFPGTREGLIQFGYNEDGKLSISASLFQEGRKPIFIKKDA